MASSKVELFNNALLALGSSKQVVSESDTLAAPFVLAWPIVSSAVARAHPWNCLMNKSTWAPDNVSDIGDDDYSYRFTLPAECLRIIAVDNNDAPWVVRQRKLYANTNAPVVRWVNNIPADIAKLDALLVSALILRLAHACCYKIVQSNSSKDQLWQDYRLAMQEAKSVDSQESAGEVYEINHWTDARGSGSDTDMRYG
jgi:hypothetical protein